MNALAEQGPDLVGVSLDASGGACADALVLHEAATVSGSARLRRRVREYLAKNEVGDSEVTDVLLCVEEAYTNAMKHSGSCEPVQIVIEARPDEVVAVVKDCGTGFDVTAFDRDVVPMRMGTSGRGLFLMARLMDELQLVACDGLTVFMRKKRPWRTGGSSSAA